LVLWVVANKGILRMGLIKVIRKTKYETRHHPRMGCLICLVTRIKKCIFGIPFKTIHKYRETYRGEVKDVKDCKLNKI
jgi:hypothetical protein